MAPLSNDDRKKKAIRLKGYHKVPLPAGWEVAHDAESGKMFFIDHNTRSTQWFDPRDRMTKPLTVADCDSDDLPYGWERAYDAKYGVYYIDHVRKKNQREDPRTEWRNLQINMLKSYVRNAEGSEAVTHGSSEGIAISMISLVSQKGMTQLDNNLTNSQPSLATLNSNPNTSPLSNQLKRDLDANLNILDILDKYDKQRNHDALAVEV